MRIEIEACFRAFLPEAIARFGYLYPHIHVQTGPDHVVLNSERSCSREASEFRYMLYRQKIFSETLELRRELIGGILR